MSTNNHHSCLPTVLLEHLDVSSKYVNSKNSTPYSSNEALFDPTQNGCSPLILRSRRGLHTTPDSSLSSVAGSTQSDCSTDDLYASSRPMRYSTTHVYYCDEEDKEVIDSKDRLITIGTDGETKPTSKVAQKLDHLLKAVSLRWITLTLAFAVVIFYFKIRSPDPVISLQSLTKQLSAEFPHQNARFWAQLRAALDPFVHRFPHPDAMGSVPALTSVILFAKLANRTLVDIGRTDCANSFACFQARFRTKLESIARYPATPRTQCQVIRTPELDATIPNHSKLLFELDEELRQSYDAGVRCFQFPALDRFPPQTVTFFHGVTDPYNTQYAGTVFLFALEESFEFDLVENLAGARSTDIQIELRVQRHLRNLWSPTLSLEEMDALLSRLARNIAVFRTVSRLSTAVAESSG